MDKQAKKTKRTKPRHKYIEGSLIYRHLIVHYALMRPTPVLNENDINFLLNRVEDEVKGITAYLRKVPSDYKHLERWFALMEDNATTNKQRCVLKQLKEHFEQLKQQSTPQTETISSRAAATQDEGAGKEVQTGTGNTIDFDTLSTFFDNKFKGIPKENNFNYFDECLREDITTIEKKKEFAMVAVLIYESRHFNKKTMSFAEWFRLFFKIIGMQPHKNPSKTRYEPNERIKLTFRYL